MIFKVGHLFGNLKEEYKNFYLKSRKLIISKINGLGEKKMFLMEISRELIIKFASSILMILPSSDNILIFNY